MIIPLTTHAQRAVVKVPGTNAITENLNFGTGKTLRMEAGSTLNATGATVTGLTSSVAFSSITGVPGDNSSLASALALKAPLASPTFTGTPTFTGGTVTITGRLDILGSGITSGLWHVYDADSSNSVRLIAPSSMSANYTLNIPGVNGTLISTGNLSGITETGTVASGTWQGSIIAPAYLGTGASITTKYLRGDGTWQTISGGGDALTTNPLSQFAATTSAQLRGVLTDASGTGVILTSNGSAASLTNFPTLNQSTTGNAATATLLQNPRAINGYNFDGAADITITCAAGTLTGSTLASGVTASSLTSVGTITSGTWQGSIVAPAYLGTGASITTKYLRGDGTWQTPSGGGDALTTNPLSQFAATTSAQLRGVLTDASGTGVILTANGSAASLTSFPTLNQSTTGNAATATAALGLKSATTTVAVDSATAPSSGQVLTATGSAAATWQTPSGGGGGNWVLVSTTTVSGSPSALDFALAGSYRHYRLEIENLYLNNDGYPVYLRTSTDGGSTYDSGGSDYDYSRGLTTGYSPASATASQIELHGAVGNGTDEGITGTVDIFDPSNAALKTSLTWRIALPLYTGNVMHLWEGAARRNAAADVTHVRIRTDQTFSGGKVRLYRWSE